ncbi:MAG TPA: type II toxin-antitoxin system RelE/ParE family toxin [Puia sp.]|nr:type II toxin-antitoxin system RelE/ParE family toxin [Puia sp.]
MANKLNHFSILSSRAQKEMAISWDWYEERQRGLGDRFLAEVLDRIKDIEKTPGRYPSRYKSYKETPVPTFPFLIIYKINSKRTIRIISVFHTSQSPRKKYK